jgi:flavin reductase (DIM6/NTAB) family NADH-FMN oxidoreductase RutF
LKVEVPPASAHRLINHGCVVLVTSASGGRTNVMTVAWQTPLSARPPLVGVSIASTHLTHELIESGGEFVVNVPGAELLPRVHLCGSISGREGDKFRKAGLTPGPARKVRPPLIEECLAHLECVVVARHRAGDHTFFVGEVVAAAAREGLFSTYWVDRPEASTLHHLGGSRYYVSGPRKEARHGD